jgi:metal-dependent amidase/aminoacylase/carboxypeptidase family protein
VIGTPAEEIGYGKPVLIRHHIFDTYDAALMGHASTKRLGYRHMLALKKIRIKFSGKSAHAATYPEEGRDALSGLILAINIINGLRASFKPFMRANGIITCGGTAPNIIPDFAEAYYFVRAITMAELDELMGWILRAVRGAAQATGTRAVVKEEGYTQYPFRVNEQLVSVYGQVLDALHLQQTKASPYQGIGSSDIGELSHVLPTLHISTPIGTKAHIHTPAFRRLAVSKSADRGIAEGALVLAMIGMELIKKPALLRQVRQGHAGR